MTSVTTEAIRLAACVAAGLGALLPASCAQRQWVRASPRPVATNPPPATTLRANDAAALADPGFFDPFAIDAAAEQTHRGPVAWQAPPRTSAQQALPVRPAAPAARATPLPIDAVISLSQNSFALDGADFDPDVSADGSTLVFASTQHGRFSKLYRKAVDGRAVTALTSGPGHDVMPKISPDGQRVAFASDRAGSWDIYVMPITGGKAMQVTTTASPELHPSWSPDGRSLVFCRLGEISGQWELWVTDVSNPGVSHFIGEGLFPEWCPVPGTGSAGRDLIVFQKSRQRGARTFGIWTLEYANGVASAPTEIASSATAACINPSWSRDGQWIVYATVPNPDRWSGLAGRPPEADLWLVSLQGLGPVKLTDGTAIDLMPVWGSTDRVYFVSDRSGVENIWSVDVTGALAAATGTVPSGATRLSGPVRPPMNRPVERADSFDSVASAPDGR